MKWIKGYIGCYVEGGSWERFMNLCRHHHIPLWEIGKSERRITFEMSAGDYKRLRPFVKKTHVVPHIREKKGVPFILEQAVRDWTFTVGLLFFFFVLRILSQYVWQINYTGQQEYTKETVSKEVTQMGVYVGMPRKRLNCDQIERNLRERYDNMSWVSAEEKGCVLNIKIKEGNVKEEEKQEETAASHLIAPCRGTVQSIVTRQGVAKVRRGDKVKKGQILISGVVDILDDSGAVVRRNGVCAAGEVTLLAEKKFHKSIKKTHTEKNKTGKNIEVYTFQWNDSRISLKNPLKWFDNSSNYDIIENICVDEAFHPWNLNIQIRKKNYIAYEPRQAKYGKKQAEEALKRKFLSWKENLKERGCQIVDSSLRVDEAQDSYEAVGAAGVYVTEMKQNLISPEELQLLEEGKEQENGTGRNDS